jgi:hypothetical protein
MIAFLDCLLVAGLAIGLIMIVVVLAGLFDRL